MSSDDFTNEELGKIQRLAIDRINLDALRITDPDTGQPISHERAWKIVARVFAFPVAARTVSINGTDYTEGWTNCIDHLRGIQ